MGSIKKQGVIDRFEGDYGVIEYEAGKNFDLPRVLIPKEAVAGDVIVFEVTLDEEATIKRRQSMEALTKNLFK